MRLKKLIIIAHRDLGYFFFGLTLIYAISGIAVNHINDWNPNYSVSTQTLELGPFTPKMSSTQLADEVLSRLEINTPPMSVVRMSPSELKIFFEGRTLTLSLPTGGLIDERVKTRPAIFQANYLHLNHGKGMWTWFADIYALALLTLAFTGIFIARGKKGLGGRGKYLIIAGLIIPLLFLGLKLW